MQANFHFIASPTLRPLANKVSMSSDLKMMVHWNFKQKNKEHVETKNEELLIYVSFDTWNFKYSSILFTFPLNECW